jgi:hypothetical protein
VALDGLGTAATTPFSVSHALLTVWTARTQAGAVIAVFVISNYLFAIIMWVLKRLIFETKVCARFVILISHCNQRVVMAYLPNAGILLLPQVFYYINTVSTTLSCFVSCTSFSLFASFPPNTRLIAVLPPAIVLLATSGTILKGWDSTPRWWITKMYVSRLPSRSPPLIVRVVRANMDTTV